MKKNIDAFVNVDDMSRIVYRRDDFGVTCFRHIDVEYSYGEYIEISEKDANFQRILDVFGITDLEKEEMRQLYDEEEIDVPEGVEGREILSYITPSVLIIDEKCDENMIEFHVECGCDWECEHGLEITIKDNKILYVGSYNGMPPYFKERLEHAGYYDEATDINMNYADKE